MKINTQTVLKTYKGEPYMQEKEKMTLGMFLSSVLANVKSKNPYKSFLLANKFATQKEIDLKSEDITFIKQVSESPEHSYQPYALGQAIAILEGELEEKSDKIKKS